MKKSKFALFIDSLVLSLITSFIIFLWLNKFYKNAIFVKIFSNLIFILCFILFLYLFYKHNNKLIFKNNNEKFLQNCINKLILLPNADYINFICKLLTCTHIENFLFKLEDKFLYINIKTELSSNDYFYLQEILANKSIKTDKLYFIYKSKNKSFDDIISISDYEINLISHESLIKAMTLNNIYPISKSEPSKINFKNKIINNLKTKCESITKKHFKEFFFSGMSLLFLSLIVPFSNYYLIIGSILLLISIISLFRNNVKSESNNSNFLFKETKK